MTDGGAQLVTRAVEDPPSEDQVRAALAWARHMRSHRAWLVDQVASGAMTIDDIFGDETAGWGSQTVRVVVLAEKLPGVGKVRARRAMQALGIGEDARWGEVEPPRLRALWVAMAEAATRPI